MKDTLSLTTFDALLAYGERRFGAWKRMGREYMFRCPFGEHRRPHLAMAEREGRGVWRCWACNVGGDIFRLHALLEGMDVRAEFREVKEGIARVLGVALGTWRRNTVPGRRPPLSFRKMKPAPEPVFLPPEEETLVWQCVERMRMRSGRDAALREALAGGLGLAPESLAVRAIFPELGTLGISPDGRLMYVYVQRDTSGALRVTGCKLRAQPGHANPFLRIRRGRWESFGTMNATKETPHGVRFFFPAGKMYGPWGMAALDGKAAVVLTEGESDALAFSEAVDMFREVYGGHVDEVSGKCFEDETGERFEACLPAVTALGGTGGFKEEWAPWFQGKVVVLAFDSDRAGRAGVEKVAKLLAGQALVYAWTPPAPFKDAREMLAGCGGMELMRSLLRTVENGCPKKKEDGDV